ncbi:MAG: response regulator [SAR324 cluster bacterium]|nr:response regulator [SAR324 cluster bacterium]
MRNVNKLERLQILIVDDDPAVLSFISKMLASHYHVTTAGSAEEALSMLRSGEYQFQIIVSDDKMPEIQGHQLAQIAHKEKLNIKFILITGYNDISIVEKAVNQGHIFGYLLKPLNAQALTNLIASAVRSIQLAKKNTENEITERERVEKALSEAYNIINRSTSVAFLWKNEADWPVEFVSENVRKLFAYSAQEFSERKILYSEVVHKDDLERVTEEVNDASRSESLERFAHKPYRIVTKDGEIKWVDDKTYIRRNSEGIITHYEGIVYDITQRMEIEKKLKETNVELFKKNLELHESLTVQKSLNDSLLKTSKKLKETQAQLIQSAKLASLGELATGIAHELNQPLNIINVYAENLSNSWKSGNCKDPSSSLEVVTGQVERATGIINHLRMFGRETRDEEYKAEDINKIVEDSFVLINEQLRLRDIEVIRNLGENLPKINCSAIQIEQVLTNIISNARDAMKKTKIKQLSVRTFCEEEQVKIEIEDTGTGIPRQVRERIFDPFFTTKEVGKGTGLGLSISHGIIENHQGTLECESEEEREGIPGKTLFRISFPIIGDSHENNAGG